MAPKLTPGSVMQEIPKFLVDKAMGIFRANQPQPPSPDQAPPQLLNPDAPQSTQTANEMQRLGTAQSKVRREPWFGPGTPMNAVAPRADVAGRARDYPTGYNLGITPRQYEPVSFPMLRGLFNGLDLAKLCVETRLNQMSKLSWEIMPRMASGEKVRKRDDPRCARLEQFFRSPDRLHDWNTWMRMLLHEMMVTDAPSLYVRRTLGGDIYALEVLRGDDILPRIDGLGRTPQAPDPAYSHILKGMPAINYTTDELIYFPRNVRAGGVYGQSPIELILLTIQIAIRRDIAKLQFWTEGNIPEALIGTPPDWTPQQIQNMQAMFDNWTSDQANRRKAYFIPGGTSFNATRPAQTLDPQQDEWLARVVTYAFNLPNLPLVAQQNRATAETANDAGLREGLAPVIVWLKGLMDLIIQKYFGFDDIEWVMDSYQEEAPDAVFNRNLAAVKAGVMSIDEMRAEMGLPGLGMPAAVFGIGPNGLMFVDDLVRAHKQGALAPQLPAAPDASGGQAMLPFDPSQGSQPGAPTAPALPPGGGGGVGNATDLAARLKQIKQMPSAPGGGDSSSNIVPYPVGGRAALPAPAVPTISHAHLAELPPEMLSAVGLKADHKVIAKAPKSTTKAGPSLVLQELEHHESRFKGKA